MARIVEGPGKGVVAPPVCAYRVASDRAAVREAGKRYRLLYYVGGLEPW